MRNLVWVALVLALGVGVWLVLDGKPADEGYELDAGAGSESEPEPAAALEGTGTGLEAEGPVEAPVGSARIRGRVVDLSGAPVAGVALELHTPERPAWVPYRRRRQLDDAFGAPSDATPPIATATSAADGTFAFERIDIRRSYTVRALPGAGRCGNVVSLWRDNLLDKVTIVVSPGVPLRVRVVGADGAGLPAWVSAYLPDDGRAEGRAVARSWRLPSIRAGADGRLALLAVPAGTSMFAVAMPGVGRRAGLAVTVPHEGEAVLRLAEADGGAVEGTVADTSGRAIAGARVMVAAYPGESESWSLRITRLATTASDGSYRVHGLPAGTVQSVSVAAEGFLYLESAIGKKPIALGQTLRADATLYRGGVLHGTVRDADGMPVPDAVLLTGTASQGFSGRDSGRAVSDADGRYRMENVPLGARRLAACAPGHYTPVPETTTRRHWHMSQVGVPFELEEEGAVLELDITLAPSLPLEGVVVDAAGTGVGGVLVQATGTLQHAVSLFRPQAVHAMTDEAGRFRFDGLPPGSWLLATSTNEGISRPLAVALKSDSAPVEIVLHPGGSVAGRVQVDGAAPPEPVSVSLATRGTPAYRRHDKRTVTTEADGSFVFADVPAGDYEVFVSAHFGQTVGERVAVSVAWGERTGDVVVEAPAVGSVRGIVVDAEGKPVSGVGVILEFDHDNMSGSWHDNTSASGSFRFDSLSPGKYVVSVAGSKDKRQVEPGAHDLRLVHHPGAQLVIEGRVLAPDGTPVAAGQVMIYFQVGNGGSHGYGARIAAGTFRHEGLRRDGTISLQITGATDAAGRPLDARPFVLADYEPDGKPLAIQLQAGLAIAGRVVDAEGAPVEGVAVSVSAKRERGNRHMWHHMSRGGPVRTDGEGRFEARGLGEGTHTVQVQQGGDWIVPQAVEAEAGARDLELKVTRGRRVSGRVVGPAGEPVVGANVRWEQKRTGAGPRLWTSSNRNATTDADGAYVIRGIENATTGRVSVGVPGENPKAYLVARQDDVVAGQKDVDFALEVGVFVEGTVKGPDGESVRHVRLGLVRTGEKGRRTRTSAGLQPGSTSFRIGPVAPGLYRLEARASGEYKNPDPIEVRAPAKGVRVVVPKGSPIKGRVLGDDVSGFQVRFRYPTGERGWGTQSARVGSDGTFLISLDADITGALFVYKQGDMRFALLNDVRPSAGPVTVTLREGKRITGRVENLDPDSKTRYGSNGVAYLRLRHASGFQLGAIVAEDGSFEAMGCPEGAYEVTVSQGRRRAKQAGVQAGTTGVVLRLEER